MRRFYDIEGDFVPIDQLIDWVRAHPLRDGRILPIIIWGGFGVGKCVGPDTVISLLHGTQKASDLWQQYHTSTQSDPSGGEWSEPSEPLSVPSWDGSRIRKGEVVRLFRQRVQESGRRITLENGRSLLSTRRHRFWTPGGWCADLQTGSQVASEEGQWLRVISSETEVIDGWVYDLEVRDFHSYLAEGLISHNTQSIKSYGAQRNIEIRTYHPAHDVNGADIVGKAYHDEESDETRYALPAWLPTEDDAPEGMLFIDELNRAPQEVLAGLMEPLGEGTIAQSNWKLPRGWNIIAAANPSEMGYMVQDLDEAMVDRMIHYAPGWDARYWGIWAEGAGLPQEIIDFALRYQGGLVTTGETQLPLEIENKLRTTPRTLEYMGALYEPGMPEGLFRVCSQGLMGRDASEALRLLVEESDRPLEAEQILSEPLALQDGSSFYPYEEPINRWLQNNISGEDLIRSSSEKLVMSLVEEQPLGDTPREDRRASLAGRYLAYLPPHLRQVALKSFQRSAPQWIPLLEEAILAWSEVLARQQKVFTQRPVTAQESE